MDSEERRLLIGLALLSTFLVGEVIAAVLSDSLALLADAGHLVTDAVALAAAIVAARLSRRPATGHWTYGWARAEILSAAVNGVTLLIAAALVLVEAIRRLAHPADVHGVTVIVIAAVGLVVNIAVVSLLHRSEHESMNMAGVLAHVITDAYSFAATIVSGIIVTTTGFDRADPIASLVVVGLLIMASQGLLRRSGRVLLEAAPSDMDIETVRSHLLGASQVIDIHDLHVWTVASGMPALSVHVVVPETCFVSGAAPQLLDELQDCLAGHFDVSHSTFQLEPAGHSDHELETHH